MIVGILEEEFHELEVILRGCRGRGATIHLLVHTQSSLLPRSELELTAEQ